MRFIAFYCVLIKHIAPAWVSSVGKPDSKTLKVSAETGLKYAWSKVRNSGLDFCS